MADYVRKTILSQGYVRINDVSLSDEQKKEFEITISAYQEPRAKRLLCADITPEVKTKDGSLIVYSTVYGSLAKLIGPTKDLLKSINSVYASSRMLADACILESLFLSGKSRKNMIRSESRTGVIKTVKDILDGIEFFVRNIESSTPKKVIRDIDSIIKKIAFLDGQLIYPQDKLMVWTEVRGYANKIPKSPSIFIGDRYVESRDKYQARVQVLRDMISGFINNISAKI